MFYDNLNNFFETGSVQKHNLTFEGGAEAYTYRLSGSYSKRKGVVPNTEYDRLNISLTGTAQLFKSLRAETNLQYINTKNIKVSKGQNSFYIGLLQFPSDVDMRAYLTPSGGRNKLTSSSTEIENPFFDVNKNKLDEAEAEVVNAHSMSPVRVLQLVRSLGGQPGKLYVVGCEPGVLENEDGQMGLSERVAAAVEPAVNMIQKLIGDLSQIKTVGPKK